MKEQKTIEWAEDSLGSIRAAERHKARLESDGWTLVHSEATAARGLLVYERVL